MQKIKIISFLYFLIFTFYDFHSQNETRKWEFGLNAGLDFASATPTLLFNGAISTTAGCASVSNSSGNLLFYTDGVTVYNQTNSIMANGTGLLGNNSAQSAVIIRQPGSQNLYYIFTVQGGNGSGGLNYSVVDMNLAAGNGSVTIKNAPLMAGSFSEKLTTTKHCNGTDFWIVAFDGNFRSYLLSSVGINTVVVTSTLAVQSSTVTRNDCMKLSPNGTKLGYLTHHFNLTNNYVYIYLLDYNNSTGAVSSPTIIYQTSMNTPVFMSPPPYGCEFSPDGTKFYYTFNGILNQTNLCAMTATNNIGLSGIASGESQIFDPNPKGTMQLASNGKIYIAMPGTQSLGVIHNPNTLGNACNFVPTGFALGSYTCQWGLPNFTGSFFEQKPLPAFTFAAFQNSCTLVSFSPAVLCPQSGYSVIGYQWNFGDPASGIANTSFLSNPVHQYPASGNYLTKLIRYFSCYSDTTVQTVQVTTPTLSLNFPTVGCGVQSATASVSGGVGPYSFTWSPSNQTTSVVSIVTTGVYTLSMVDLGGGCAATTTANINSNAVNSAINSTNISCFSANNGAASVTVIGGSGVYSYTWSNTVQNTVAINAMTPGNYTVTVYDQTYLCTFTHTFNISQPPLINLSVSVSPNFSACVGNSITLDALATGGTPAFQYTWSGGPASNSYSTTQIFSGNYIYTVTSFDANGCSISNTTTLSFVAYPLLALNGVSLCPTFSGVLNASGANVYTWQPGNLNGNSITVSPVATTIYTVTGNNSGCISTSTALALVYPIPNATVTSNSPICENQSLILSGSAGISYLWVGPQGYSSTQQNPVINTAALTNNGNYSYTVTNQNSCNAVANVNVIVNANPIISISGTTLLCKGQTTTLTASGANTYTWNNGSNNPVSIISPSVSSSYSVSGSFSITGCVNTKTIVVNLSDCLSINRTLEEQGGVKIYPNPNSGNFYIESFKTFYLVIYNPLGQLVHEANFEAGLHPVSLPNCSEGLYTIQIKSDNLLQSNKVLITR